MRRDIYFQLGPSGDDPRNLGLDLSGTSQPDSLMGVEARGLTWKKQVTTTTVAENSPRLGLGGPAGELAERAGDKLAERAEHKQEGPREDQGGVRAITHQVVETEVQWESFDYIGIGSAVIGIICVAGMVFGSVPVNELTVSIVTFSALPPALLARRAARSRKKK